ncbi:hypothetical protein MKX03_033193 [Papaver bracteatum]|nr:hypothetical protein MKX03_033193 [Papaver bracteatum]
MLHLVFKMMYSFHWSHQNPHLLSQSKQSPQQCYNGYSNYMAARTCGLVGLEPTRLYAPTTLAPACDFWLMPSVLEDGSLVHTGRSKHATSTASCESRNTAKWGTS